MKKMFAIVCTAVMLSGIMTGLPAAAEEKSVSIETAGEEIGVMTEGLIYSTSLSVSKNGTSLCINAYTKSAKTMKTIGFKDIVVEYSTDNARACLHELSEYTKPKHNAANMHCGKKR